MSAQGGIPEELVATLAAAERVVVLSGAGLSAESGVPTFRDAQTGLWARFRPEDLATPEAFRRDPATVWRWYQWRRDLVSRVEPNAGHQAIARLARQTRVTVVTQNVDGLHERAGSGDVIELHGRLDRSVCVDHRHPVAEPGAGEPPACPRCGAPLRPDVVWFGEALQPAALERAFDEVSRADLVMTVGTSNRVQPAASLPFEAVRNHVPVVEVNTEATPFTPHSRWHLRGRAAALLPPLIDATAQE